MATKYHPSENRLKMLLCTYNDHIRSKIENEFIPSLKFLLKCVTYKNSHNLTKNDRKSKFQNLSEIANSALQYDVNYIF